MKAAIALLVVLPSFAQQPAALYSAEKEVALGSTLVAEVARQYKALDDPATFEYVNQLAQALARESGMPHALVLKLIETREPRVMALPGGFLFVSSGLIVRAEGESELAGVLAHEIAHIAARHATRQVARGTVASFATVPVLFVGGWGGMCNRFAGGQPIPTAFQSAARNFEREADLLGLQYLYRAGYDPAGLVSAFRRLSPSRPSEDAGKFREVKQRVMQLTGTHEPARPTLRK